jgi:hypothetical protein
MGPYPRFFEKHRPNTWAPASASPPSSTPGARAAASRSTVSAGCRAGPASSCLALTSETCARASQPDAGAGPPLSSRCSVSNSWRKIKSVAPTSFRPDERDLPHLAVAIRHLDRPALPPSFVVLFQIVDDLKGHVAGCLIIGQLGFFRGSGFYWSRPAATPCGGPSNRSNSRLLTV